MMRQLSASSWRENKRLYAVGTTAIAYGTPSSAMLNEKLSKAVKDAKHPDALADFLGSQSHPGAFRDSQNS